jgi:CheY-like chemotaxis protein
LGYVNKAAAPPDAIVLDVEMPRMNGYEVCRILKGDPVHRNIPIVMLTALDEESDKEWGLDVGADAYLTKPVDFSELMKTLTGVFTGAARGR